MSAKETGGLGFKHLGVWNVASIGRQVWSLATKADMLWVKWIAAIYLKREEFMEVTAKQGDSWHWKQLLKTRDSLRVGFRGLQWSTSADGQYSVASGYAWLMGEGIQFRYAKNVWNRFTLPKQAFILWLVLRNRMLTMDRISSWFGDNVDLACSLCLEKNESVSHLYFECAYSREVVTQVAAWLGLSSVPFTHSRWCVWMEHCSRSRSVQANCWVSGLTAVVYWLWGERNCRRHGRGARSSAELVRQILQELNQRHCLMRAASHSSNLL